MCSPVGSILITARLLFRLFADRRRPNGHGAVIEGDLHLLSPFHHMIVGNDVARSVPHETGALALGQCFGRIVLSFHTTAGAALR